MLQIRIHARGGLGGKSLAQIIAETSLELGNYIQAFPEYGPERAGAPLRTFVRIDNKQIRLHEPVLNPDISIVLDETLLVSGNVIEGMSNNSILIVNTEKTKDEILSILKDYKGELYMVPATKIALETIGSNKPGSPIAGGLCRFTKLVTLEALKEDVVHKFSRKGEEIVEANQKAIEMGFRSLI